ncbi:MAG: pyridoxamine 5'-phosphate oxidase family protein [Candidatus Promineifilaceae bacterium]
MENYGKLLFVNDVRELQDQVGSGEKYARFYEGRTKASLDEGEIDFIGERESFYIASVSSTGWPYVQHRGGPKGFLKVIGKNRLGFADYQGNRQFITMGHAAHDDRVALFLMDYEHRSRLKMLGRLTMQNVEDADPALRAALETSGQGKIERIATIEIVATDWNCPKYIPQLIELEKVKQFVNTQLQDLRDENARLKQQIERLKAL